MMQNRFRIFALIAAALGILSGVAFVCFWGDGWLLPYLSTKLVLYYFASYFIVAAAAIFSTGRVVPALTACASFVILALGVHMYLDIIRQPGINDIELFILPLQRLIAIVAVIVAVIGFAVHHAPNAPNVAS